MSSAPMTARSAQRLAGVAIGACVLAGLGIGAALLLGLPGLPSPPPLTPAGATPGAVPGADVPSVEIDTPEPESWSPPRADGDAIAARLALIDNAPRIHDPEPDEPAEDEPPAEGEASDAETQVKYLGMIRSGETRRAVLRVGERQRIVREGDTLTLPDGNQIRLVQVRADAAILEGDGERTRLTKGQRESANVTVVAGEAPSGSLSGSSRPATPESPELPDTPEINRILQDHERRVNAIRERIERGLLTEESGQRLLESIETQREQNIERALRRERGREGQE